LRLRPTTPRAEPHRAPPRPCGRSAEPCPAVAPPRCPEPSPEPAPPRRPEPAPPRPAPAWISEGRVGDGDRLRVGVCGRVGWGWGCGVLGFEKMGRRDDGSAGYGCVFYFGIFNPFPECLPTGSRGILFSFFLIFLGNPTLFELLVHIWGNFKSFCYISLVFLFIKFFYILHASVIQIRSM
jgi:hypothetical protein